jgi:hypothetical protein
MVDTSELGGIARQGACLTDASTFGILKGRGKGPTGDSEASPDGATPVGRMTGSVCV